MLQGRKLLEQCLRAWREAKDVAASENSSSSGQDTDSDVHFMRARAVAQVSDQPLWELVKEQGERSTRQEEQIIMLTNDLSTRDKLLEGLRADNDRLFVENMDLLTRLQTSESRVALLASNASGEAWLGIDETLHDLHEQEVSRLNGQVGYLQREIEHLEFEKKASDLLFAALKRECDAVKEQLTALQSAASTGPSPPPAASLPPPPPPPGGGPPPPPPPPPPAASGVTPPITPQSKSPAAKPARTPQFKAAKNAKPVAPAAPDMMAEMRAKQAAMARAGNAGSIDVQVNARKREKEEARNETSICGVNPSDMIGALEAGVKALRTAVEEREEGEEYADEWSDDDK